MALELFHGGVWNDIAADGEVFAEKPIVIRQGLGDESGGWPRPASISAQLDNRTDKYRTSNPESDLYGLAGRNTPMRVSVGGTVRGVVEASSWAADQTDDFRRTPPRGKAWVDVAGGGLLQRLGQFTTNIGSPYRRYNQGIADLAGYWPMEDERGSPRAASTVPGAVNTVLFGTSFGSQERAPGSDPVANVVVQDGATFQFTGGTVDATDGWQYGLTAFMGDMQNGFYSPIITTTKNGGNFFVALDDSTNMITILVSQAGSTVLNSSTSWGSYSWEGRWISLVLDVSYSGGTTTVTFKWRALDETAWNTFSDTYSGIPSHLHKGFGGGLPDGSAFGHVIGTHGRTDDLTSDDRWTALQGHPGELAALRFSRLIDELLGTGHHYVSAGWADSIPLGPQHSGTPAEVLGEIIRTEDALLYDHGTELKLYFVCRVDRYNQTPALTLNAAGTDHGMPGLPREVNDGKIAGNVVTASQWAGGESVARDDTGPLGTQDPPDGVGVEERTVDVNLDGPETMLPQVANWWLRRGTVDLPRYPQVKIDLAAVDAATLAEVEAVAVGSVIEITGYRENTIRLYVLGWTETIGTHTRSITFTCAPDQQFHAGTLDDADFRIDLGSSTTTAVAGPTETTLTVDQTDQESWSVTGTPYDWLISGEQITVTRMSQPGSIAVSDGSFEVGTTGWAAFDGTLTAQSSVVWHGTQSAQLEVVGSPAQSYVRNNTSTPVTVGEQYTVTAWMRGTGSTAAALSIDWYDSGFGYLSTDAVAITVTAEFARYQFTATAPASAAFVGYGPTLTGSPSAGTLLYFDDIDIAHVGTTTQTAQVTRSVNGIRKTLPADSAVHVPNPVRLTL